MWSNDEMESEESTPILLGDASYKERKNLMNKDLMFAPEKIYRNFTLMCISFSLNHACIVACLAYTSAELGDKLGSTCSGILYVTFALSAFLISNPIVIAIGPRLGMLLGVVGYCIYIFGFLFAIMTVDMSPDFAWIVACGAAAIGGVAGGVLWTSQGRYVTRHATLYSETTGVQLEKVNSDFASVFATYFLYMEMAAKLFATIVYVLAPEGAPFLVFSLYTMLAMASCFIVAGLNDLDDPGSWEFSYKTISHDVGAAGRLVYEDQRLVLIIPYQIAFGFTSSLIVYYIMGTVIAQSVNLGKAYVGLLSALVVLSGAITALPLGRVANTAGKSFVILIGNLCMIATGLFLYMFSDAQLGTWTLIVPYLVIFGVARGVWENVNRAAIADMFGLKSAECSTAYSATGFFTGYASALGYFSFYAVSRSSMAGVVLGVSCVSLVCYQSAFLLNQKLSVQKSLDSHKKEIVRRRFFEYAKEREMPPGQDREQDFTHSMSGGNNKKKSGKETKNDVARTKSDDLL